MAKDPEMKIRIGGDNKQFKKKVDEVKGILGGKLPGGPGTLGALIGGMSFGGIAIKGLDAMNDLATAAERLGINMQESQELLEIFARKGMQLEDMLGIFNGLTAAMAAFGEGAEKETKAFSELGLEFEKLEKLSPKAQFFAIAEAINKIPDNKKGAILQALFGEDDASRVLQVIKQGRAELEKQADAAVRVSDVETEKIKAAQELGRVLSARAGMSIGKQGSLAIGRAAQFGEKVAAGDIASIADAGTLLNPITALYRTNVETYNIMVEMAKDMNFIARGDK